MNTDKRGSWRCAAAALVAVATLAGAGAVAAAADDAQLYSRFPRWRGRR